MGGRAVMKGRAETFSKNRNADFLNLCLITDCQNAIFMFTSLIVATSNSMCINKPIIGNISKNRKQR